jgi:hypothetical protein
VIVCGKNATPLMTWLLCHLSLEVDPAKLFETDQEEIGSRM